MATLRSTSSTYNEIQTLSDYLFLGGFSIIAFVLLQIIPVIEHIEVFAVVMMILANFVNHPHFAHSYQLFYRDWSTIKHSTQMKTRIRWWFAAVGAPLVALVYFSIAWFFWHRGEGAMLSLSLNLMALLVGWHYVKQGFGMCMTDAATKQCFWSVTSRQAMLINAYACWACAWLLANGSSLGKVLWGIAGVPINIPAPFILGSLILVTITTLYCTFSIFQDAKKWRSEGKQWHQQPWAGLLAYAVSIYLWSVFIGIDPVYFLVVPFFHSLQYMTIVWKYNRGAQTDLPQSQKKSAQWRFYSYGVILGMAGFWLIPITIDWLHSGRIPDSLSSLAPGLMTAWVVINIHHYIIDNSLWRKDNPLVERFLFKQTQ